MKGKFKENFYLIKNEMKNMLKAMGIFVATITFAISPTKDEWFPMTILFLNYLAILTLLVKGTEKENNSDLYGKVLPISTEEYQGGIYLSQLTIFIIITLITGILSIINKGNLFQSIFMELGFLTIFGGVVLFLSNISNQKVAFAVVFIVSIMLIMGFVKREELFPYIGKIYTYKYLYLIIFIIGALVYTISYFMSVKLMERRVY